MSKELEEGRSLQLDWSKITKIAAVCDDVIPCAVQHADNKDLILVAYVNQRALDHSLQTGTATFWSTSRNELWEKGKTSGESYELVSVRVNCEQNSLLYLVRPRAGGICHTKNQAGDARDCYYRELDPKSGELTNLDP